MPPGAGADRADAIAEGIRSFVNGNVFDAETTSMHETRGFALGLSDFILTPRGGAVVKACVTNATKWIGHDPPNIDNFTAIFSILTAIICSPNTTKCRKHFDKFRAELGGFWVVIKKVLQVCVSTSTGDLPVYVRTIEEIMVYIGYSVDCGFCTSNVFAEYGLGGLVISAFTVSAVVSVIVFKVFSKIFRILGQLDSWAVDTFSRALAEPLYVEFTENENGTVTTYLEAYRVIMSLYPQYIFPEMVIRRLIWWKERNEGHPDVGRLDQLIARVQSIQNGLRTIGVRQGAAMISLLRDPGRQALAGIDPAWIPCAYEYAVEFNGLQTVCNALSEPITDMVRVFTILSILVQLCDVIEDKCAFDDGVLFGRGDYITIVKGLMPDLAQSLNDVLSAEPATPDRYLAVVSLVFDIAIRFSPRVGMGYFTPGIFKSTGLGVNMSKTLAGLRMLVVKGSIHPDVDLSRIFYCYCQYILNGKPGEVDPVSCDTVNWMMDRTWGKDIISRNLSIVNAAREYMAAKNPAYNRSAVAKLREKVEAGGEVTYPEWRHAMRNVS